MQSHIRIRIDEELKKKLKQAALANHRSMNGEVVMAVESHLANKKAEESQLGGPNSSASQQRSKEINQL